MRIHFDDDEVLHICPKNSVEAMALRYWLEEYKAHGDKMLVVETSVPKPVE